MNRKGDLTGIPYIQVLVILFILYIILAFGVAAVVSNKGKLEIIEKKLGGSLKDAVFYATSHNDIPLLEKVGKPVVINPTSKLLAHAKKNGWEILKVK